MRLKKGQNEFKIKGDQIVNAVLVRDKHISIMLQKMTWEGLINMMAKVVVDGHTEKGFTKGYPMYIAHDSLGGMCMVWPRPETEVTIRLTTIRYMKE